MAAPEAANNAGAQTSFIPMLTLGIPANPVMALMIGALMIQGIQPGPTIITEQATLFWGVVVSMWIGNVFLLILNLPLIGLWVRMITVPYRLLFPAIMVFCAIGVFSISNTVFDVYLMAAFGLLGYVFHKLGCEPTPLLLGFILGPPMEEFLRRALVLSEGSPVVLVREPLSARCCWPLPRCCSLRCCFRPLPKSAPKPSFPRGEGAGKEAQSAAPIPVARHTLPR